MGDKRSDEASNTLLSSPDSVVATASNRTLHESASESTATPVNLPHSKSDYSGTRFTVTRMASSELQSVTTSDDSPARETSRAASQPPRSVKFVDDGERPGTSKAKTPEKSPAPGLSKSLTSTALSKLLEFQPMKLFSQKSQDTFPSKEEIDLPTMNRGIRSSVGKDSSDEEEFFDAGRNVTEARAKTPLLLATATVEEVPNTPGASSEDTTFSVDKDWERCCMSKTIYVWVTIISFVVFVGIGVWLCYQYISIGKGDLAVADPLTQTIAEPFYEKPNGATTVTFITSEAQNIIAGPTEGTTSTYKESTVDDMPSDHFRS